MWYHPVAFFVGKRDVIGAWVICLALATAFFAYPVVITALDAKSTQKPACRAILGNLSGSSVLALTKLLRQH